MHKPPLFVSLTGGDASASNFTDNGHVFDMGYYLDDDIYPTWSTSGTKRLENIMTACVILHKMITEDGRGLDLDLKYDNVVHV